MENKYSDQDKQNIIEIWKQVVNVQMHFNDIEIKIRNFAITIFTFIFAGVGFCIKENVFIYEYGTSISLATLVSGIGIIVLFALFIMDKWWYHRLLHGSVSQGMDIEKSFSKFYPEMKLTTTIKKASSIKLWFFKIKFDSNFKLYTFYSLLILPFIISFFGLLSFNSELALCSEYNYVSKNASKVEQIDDIPKHAGLFLIFDSKNNLIKIEETANLKKTITSYSKQDTLLAYKNAYFVETRIARKELEELIKEKGIELKK